MHQPLPPSPSCVPGEVASHVLTYNEVCPSSRFLFLVQCWATLLFGTSSPAAQARLAGALAPGEAIVGYMCVNNTSKRLDSTEEQNKLASRFAGGRLQVHLPIASYNPALPPCPGTPYSTYISKYNYLLPISTDLIWHLASGIWHLAPDTWHPAFKPPPSPPSPPDTRRGRDEDRTRECVRRLPVCLSVARVGISLPSACLAPYSRF